MGSFSFPNWTLFGAVRTSSIKSNLTYLYICQYKQLFSFRAMQRLVGFECYTTHRSISSCSYDFIVSNTVWMMILHFGPVKQSAHPPATLGCASAFLLTSFICEWTALRAGMCYYLLACLGAMTLDRRQFVS